MRGTWVLAIALAAGCATGPEEGSVRLSGRVTRGPVTPVCRPDIPCEEPFAGDFDVERGGRRVARFRSGRDGTFAVWLVPDAYVVRWVSGGFGQGVEVHVEAPATTADLAFDTGIR